MLRYYLYVTIIVLLVTYILRPVNNKEITEKIISDYLSILQGVALDRLDELGKKEFVDSYVREMKVFSDSINVVLQLGLGVDKSGVGGLIHILCNYLYHNHFLIITPNLAILNCSQSILPNII